jgi:hypothetical protein
MPGSMKVRPSLAAIVSSETRRDQTKNKVLRNLTYLGSNIQ